MVILTNIAKFSWTLEKPTLSLGTIFGNCRLVSKPAGGIWQGQRNY
jgi:hypothetical protein